MSDVFQRLVGGTEPKLPAHPLTIAVTMVDRGILSQSAVSGLFGLDVADWSEIDDILGRVDNVVDPNARISCGQDVWRLFLLAEWDKDDVAGLRDVTAFKARVDELVSFYNGLA